MYSIAVGLYGPIVVRDRLICAQMDACIAMDEIEYDTKPFPWLYDCFARGEVVYRTTACDASTCTDVPWEDPWTIKARGWTDCKNLAKWRIVELRKRKGLYSVTYSMSRIVTPAGDVIYHPIVVDSRNPALREDPSEICGMGKEGSVIAA